MFDLDKIKEIFQTIGRNRTRSFLTAFGVFWGVFMLVILIGGGKGLQFMLAKQVGGFASNSCLFQSMRTSEAYKGFKKGRYWNLSLNDLRIIKTQVPEVDDVAGILFSGEVNCVHQERSATFGLKGVSPNMSKISFPLILKGRYINDIDMLEKRKVCVIGERVYESLFFAGQDPIGQTIRFNGIFFTVIGVIKQASEGVNIGGNDTEAVLLPLSTMQQTFNTGNTIHLILLTTKEGYRVKELEEKVLSLLKREHKIAPHDKKGVFSMNLEQQFLMLSNLFLGVNILIWLVGIGTLLAGLIGVSNIMMVTVKERTQEIGIRRALGARPIQILSQILSETAVLTVSAGLLGISFGVLVLQVLDMIIGGGAGQSAGFMLPFGTAIATTFVLIILSLTAGILPAVRAMKIKAIEALQEE